MQPEFEEELEYGMGEFALSHESDWGREYEAATRPRGPKVPSRPPAGFRQPIAASRLRQAAGSAVVRAVREPLASGYRFRCADNCPLGGGIAECRRVYQADLAQAIRMARNAARLVANPARQTGDIYQRVFGHRPNRRVPWAGNATSGSITVRRLRLAARALEKGFFPIACAPCVDGNAVTTLDGPRTRIELCANYWNNASRSIRAGILIHETLHAYFEFINDARDGNFPTTVQRTNAHCYEALVMLLHGITPDNADTTMCQATPS
jgi:hypothetical protein